jgi:hypothetical protein
MRTEHARQTRWDRDPEPADPAQVPPGSLYIQQIVWVPCIECDLQVHAVHTGSLTTGVTCPECGRRLAAPLAPDSLDAAVSRVRREEECFREQMQR